MGEIGLGKGRFSQVQASQGWAEEHPTSIGHRLLAAGFRIIEFWPEGRTDGNPELLIVGEVARLLSDHEARTVAKSSQMNTQDKMRFYGIEKRNAAAMRASGLIDQSGTSINLPTASLPAIPHTRRVDLAD